MASLQHDMKEQAKTRTRKGEEEYRILLSHGRFIAYAYEKPDGTREKKISIALDTGEKIMLIPLSHNRFLAIPDTFDEITTYDPISKTLHRIHRTPNAAHPLIQLLRENPSVARSHSEKDH